MQKKTWSPSWIGKALHIRVHKAKIGLTHLKQPQRMTIESIFVAQQIVEFITRL